MGDRIESSDDNVVVGGITDLVNEKNVVKLVCIKLMRPTSSVSLPPLTIRSFFYFPSMYTNLIKRAQQIVCPRDSNSSNIKTM